MKMRILDDSIRLRLTRAEVETIRQGTPVVARTHFADGSQLSYALRPGETAAPEAIYRNGEVSLVVPAHELHRWATTDAVSIAAEHGDIRILIEKDFACIQPRAGEDQSDRFVRPEHPAAGPG